MRPSRFFALLFVVSPAAIGFACSSSDSAAPASAGGASGAAGASGASGASAGAGGAGGDPAGAGGTDATGQGGTGASAGSTGGPTGAGGVGSSLCKSQGDAAIFGLAHPECQPCAVNWCDDLMNVAYGSGWSKGDLTTGGLCQAYEQCATGKCGCAPLCVTKTCASALSMPCQDARTKAQMCIQASCNLPCGMPPPDQDAGM